MAKLKFESNNIFKRWKDRLANAKPVMQSVADFMLSETKAAAPVNTGRLRDSFKSKYDNHTAELSSDKPYVWQRQEGGTITVKDAKYLCIPVSWQAKSLTTGAGGAHGFNVRAIIKKYDLFKPKDKLVLARNVNGKLEVWFALKTEVAQKGKDYLMLPTNKKTIQFFKDRWYAFMKDGK